MDGATLIGLSALGLLLCLPRWLKYPLGALLFLTLI